MTRKYYFPQNQCVIEIIKPLFGKRRIAIGGAICTELQIRNLMQRYRRWLTNRGTDIRTAIIARIAGFGVFYTLHGIEVGCQKISLWDIEFLENLLWKV